MFRQCFFLLFAFLILSPVNAAPCPDLSGLYVCGFDSKEFFIEIQQEQTESGATAYKLFDDFVTVTADGVERDVPAIYGEIFTGHYSAVCKDGGLEASVEGVFSALDDVLMFPFTAKMTLAPVTRGETSLIEGNVDVELKGKHPNATKEFVTGTLNLKLSDEKTLLSCQKTEMEEEEI